MPASRKGRRIQETITNTIKHLILDGFVAGEEIVIAHSIPVRMLLIDPGAVYIYSVGRLNISRETIGIDIAGRRVRAPPEGGSAGGIHVGAGERLFCLVPVEVRRGYIPAGQPSGDPLL